MTGQGDNHLEAIPCSPQTVESLLPSTPDDTPIVSKAITQSSRQSHPMCLETKSFLMETASKLDFSCHPEVDEDLSWNPKCITMLDWIEA